jgi:UDP-N-acetylglucosamine 2-epimerase (non-hydrolysing)
MFDLRVAPMSRIVVAYGTRPERIKMQPVVDALRTRGFEVEEWCSGQSRDLLSDLDVQELKMWSSGHLTDGVGGLIALFGSRLRGWPADAVVVQGDTATAFACAQAAFLSGVPVAHVEAGMRTYAAEPFPEEAFRRQIAAVATWSFCPGDDEYANLMVERNSAEGLYVTGNTVIDTLPQRSFNVLATLHRRENWGARIATAIAELRLFAQQRDVDITLIRHPNWATHQSELPDETPRFRYVPPMDRDRLLEALQSVDLVVTDSGGLQEEAAHFGVDCVVYRSSTERCALERTGAISIARPDTDELKSQLAAALAKRRCYGSGDSGRRIAEILARELVHS